MKTSVFFCLALSLVVLLVAACGASAVSYVPPPRFSPQLAVASPHDEPGGYFDGASLSPGFGVLYLNGYTQEGAQNDGCGGFFGDEPEHLLEVGYAMNLKLVVQSLEGLVLGVQSPDGVLNCWDEDSSSNLNVSLEQHYQPGVYRVWVGSTEQATSHAYRLVLSE